MGRCTVAMYTVLGSFRSWSPVSYIIEDYRKDKRRRKRAAFGIAADGATLKSCIYESHGCEPFSTVVAEYALALHKLLYTGCDIHLTFFTPLTLLQNHVQVLSNSRSCFVDYDIILEETRKLARELGARMSGATCQQQHWCPIIHSLYEAYINEPAWSPVKVVTADAKICVPGGSGLLGRRITTYMVPTPIRLNQAAGDKLLINYADLDSTEGIASVWINAMLRKLKPELAVLDTTHGVNYVALLIERAFKRATTTLPVDSSVQVQVYNTDPVIGRPSSQAIYKYHLIDDIDDKHYTGISSLTRSPPCLASILSEYANERLEVIMSSKTLDEETKDKLKALISVLIRAARSFNNDVILWGFVLSEKARSLVRDIIERLIPEPIDGSWLEVREEIQVSSSIVKIYQYPAARGDKGKREAVATRAKLRLMLDELLGLLDSASRVWKEIKEMLGIRRIGPEPETEDYIDYLIDRAEPGPEHRLHIIYCRKELEGKSHPSYFPVAAYTLLKHELKEIPRICCKPIKPDELDQRNFIAHGGLSRGIVLNVTPLEKPIDGRECYRIEVSIQRLKEALNMV